VNKKSFIKTLIEKRMIVKKLTDNLLDLFTFVAFWENRDEQVISLKKRQAEERSFL
jgi:hypothetical protein